MKDKEIYVVGTARTAIGTFGGSLKDVPNTQLATTAVRAALERSGVAPDAIGHVVMGNVIPTDVKDAYLSRVAAVDAGIPVETPAFNVNRLCGSGLQAIVSAAQSIALGDCDIAIGGGSESMSRGPYFDTAARFGARMGDAALVDYMLGILHDPWEKIHMGITAENVAARYRISREQQDALAVQSQQRAVAAIAAGRFKEQIVPVELKTRKGVVMFDTDEHVRADTTLESLAKMKPAFKKDGLVTAGNASGINDGAAAVVLARGLPREGAGPEAAGAPGGLRARGGRAGLHGHRSGPGDAQGARTHGAESERPGRDRVERGLRGAGLRGDPGAGVRSGQGEPERLGHLAGSSGGRDRRDHHDQGDRRAAPHGRALRAGHDVYRWWARHRRGVRTLRLNPRPWKGCQACSRRSSPD
jgi:acetyl-CoA acetyltransferase